jgi:hypothetical protein
MLQTGLNTVKLRIEKLHLNPDVYVLGLWLSQLANCSRRKALDYVEAACEVEVVSLTDKEFGANVEGAVTCEFKVLEVT